MNREQRRALVKKARKNGMKKELAETYAAIAGGTGTHTPPTAWNEGDRVMLNIPAILARKNYDRMADAYKAFVQDAKDKVFTAHVERPNLISLKEDPRWLFWSGDLLAAAQEENDDAVTEDACDE